MPGTTALAVAIIGKLSFPYVDSILKSWQEKKITTPQEAMQEQKREEPAKQSSVPAARKGQDGLGTPSYDLDEINRLLLDAAINPQKGRA